MALRDFIQLLRLQQWYKNLVIFLPIIFVGQLLELDKLLAVLAGFFALALMSSANYVINDVVDAARDRSHPEKRQRPLAAGKVRPWQALALAAVLFATSAAIALQFPTPFFYSLLFLFCFTQFYSLVLKRETFADVLAIGINFVNRAVAGAFIISVAVSPWLILCTFFLSLFLSVGKRAADLKLLGSSAAAHREVLKHYSPQLTNALMIVTTTCLVMSYSLYSFLSEHKLLILTLPFMLYAIFRYTQLVYAGSEIARQPEKFFKDARICISLGLWTAAVVLILYI